MRQKNGESVGRDHKTGREEDGGFPNSAAAAFGRVHMTVCNETGQWAEEIENHDEHWPPVAEK